MKFDEWHWAQLKRDFEIEDIDLLGAMGVAVPVTLPAGTLVYAVLRGGAVEYETYFTLTLGPTTTTEHPFAFQAEFDVSYHALLEPLE